MSLRVLAIDDSLTIRTLLSEALERAGCTVTTAADGKEGLEKFSETESDVVVTDINMPELDGFGVIDGIRKGSINNTIPIMVLTTETSRELKERARRAGASGWISKPFSDDALISALHRISGTQ